MPRQIPEAVLPSPRPENYNDRPDNTDGWRQKTAPETHFRRFFGTLVTQKDIVPYFSYRGLWRRKTVQLIWKKSASDIRQPSSGLFFYPLNNFNGRQHSLRCYSAVNNKLVSPSVCHSHVDRTTFRSQSFMFPRGVIQNLQWDCGGRS